MKHRYYNVITFCFIVVLSLSLFSCVKCKNKTYPSLTLTTADLQLIPYSGNEKLVFQDSVNDSIDFGGRGRILNSSLNYIYDDCKSQFEAEMDDCIFIDSIKNGHVELKLGFAGDGKSYESLKKKIFIGVFPSNGIGGFDGEYYFTNDSILPGTRVSFVKSLLIGTRMFTSVYLLITETSTTEKESITLLYFSALDGIIAWKTNKKHLWIIKK